MYYWIGFIIYWSFVIFGVACAVSFIGDLMAKLIVKTADKRYKSPFKDE